VPVLGKRSTTASAGPMVTINIAVMSSIIVTNIIKHLMRHLLTLTLPHLSALRINCSFASRATEGPEPLQRECKDARPASHPLPIW
jgi:hypothetical protein